MFSLIRPGRTLGIDEAPQALMADEDALIPAPHILDSTEQLKAFLAELPTAESGLRRCAVDTEADSLHSYKEKLCLIQFGCAGRFVIIDPLLIKDLTPLLDFLQTAEIWMHGADFDMSLMRRTFGMVPTQIFDTQTAARLCGHRQFGLAHLVKEKFAVELCKTSQRANWGKRPLTPMMAEYAINDVRYVLPLADLFLAQLSELGRLEWFYQSCQNSREAVLNRQPSDPDECWRVTGWGVLQPKGLAALRALWHWRNGEAERLDRPPFKVINNEYLVEYALMFQDDKIPVLPERFPPPPRRRFGQALDVVKKIPATEWPKRRRKKFTPRPPEAEARFDYLKEERDRLGVALDIEGALIASRNALEDISTDVAAAASLCPWQAALLSPCFPGLAAIEAPSEPRRPRGGRPVQAQVPATSEE